MINTAPSPQTIIQRHTCFFQVMILAVVWCIPVFGNAATLNVSPPTGVYSVGNTFSVNVFVDTKNASVNAADAQLSFNPRELSVTSVSRSASIFNLWTQEPTFSNTQGTITFGGGSPTGYRGSAGTIITITFKALSAGSPKVTFSSGSVLAADGLGTNILTAMNGGNYTVHSIALTPEPEYIAAPNTPKAPRVTSSSHPDEGVWYRNTTAEIAWQLPPSVTAVRTLLDQSPSSIPTIVHEPPISSRTLSDLPEGISYFHVQFRNADGWGKVAHVALRVDTEPPSAFVIEHASDIDSFNPRQKVVFRVLDISPIVRYRIQIDGGEPYEVPHSETEGGYILPKLTPGYHTLIVEAFDSAGNSRVATHSFTIDAFEPPTFTDYPSRLSTSVIPAIRGSSRPGATVIATLVYPSGGTETFETIANDEGVFLIVPKTAFTVGVYEMSAIARDVSGAQSSVSQPIRIIVEEPGLIRIGVFLVNALSVIVPLVLLIIALIFGSWRLVHRLSVWKRRVIRETEEAEQKLKTEFTLVIEHLDQKIAELKTTRGGKLTKAEQALIGQIEQDLTRAQKAIQKEISDIDDVVQ